MTGQIIPVEAARQLVKHYRERLIEHISDEIKARAGDGYECMTLRPLSKSDKDIVEAALIEAGYKVKNGVVYWTKVD